MLVRCYYASRERSFDERESIILLLTRILGSLCFQHRKNWSWAQRSKLLSKSSARSGNVECCSILFSVNLCLFAFWFSTKATDKNSTIFQSISNGAIDPGNSGKVPTPRSLHPSWNTIRNTTGCLCI